MDVIYANVERFDQYLDNVGHPWSVQHFPGLPWKLFAVVAIYLVFVMKLGPGFMRNRKPYQLETAMRLYNVVNILVNLVMFLVGMYYTRFTIRCWSCIDPRDDSTPLWAQLLAGKGYMYLKVFDLLDTVFFILRKKSNQVTPLHVIHHAVMPLTVYFGVKLAPYTFIIMTAILNTFVHVVMYTYYLLASYGPKMAPYLWWKKYLTLIQLVQFTIHLVHATAILITANCDYPRFLSYVHILEGSYFMYAFGKFYIQSYNRPQGENKKKG
ncbi:Elongation of very long chain fatty acids protein 7 [Halotydeus destructor]|nr:Elongation of very long chain fatty acids protein 7 [Halotydeus destructor]